MTRPNRRICAPLQAQGDTRNSLCPFFSVFFPRKARDVVGRGIYKLLGRRLDEVGSEMKTQSRFRLSRSPSLIKYIVLFGSCFLFRFLPLRPPNVEPILAAVMPIAKKDGWMPAFLFGFSSIALFDISVGLLGPWTLITAPVYGLLGVAASLYFRRRSGRLHYGAFALVATILYDAATGLTVGPLFFNQPFMGALLGQIPFTLLHVIGNVSFAVFISPLLVRWLEREPSSLPRTYLWIPQQP